MILFLYTKFLVCKRNVMYFYRITLHTYLLIFRFSVLNHCSIPASTQLFFKQKACRRGCIAHSDMWWGESRVSLFALLFHKYLSHSWFHILPYLSQNKCAGFFKESSWNFDWNFKKYINYLTSSSLQLGFQSVLTSSRCLQLMLGWHWCFLPWVRMACAQGIPGPGGGERRAQQERLPPKPAAGLGHLTLRFLFFHSLCWVIQGRPRGFKFWVHHRPLTSVAPSGFEV